MVRVWLDEILYVESLKEYARIFLPGGKSIVTKIQIGELENMPEMSGFLRITADLASLRQIEAFTANDVTIGGKDIPIGRQYKESTQEALDRFLG